MKKIVLCILAFILFFSASSAYALEIRGALILSNSNYSEKYEGTIETVDLNLHYGLEVDVSVPILPGILAKIRF